MIRPIFVCILLGLAALAFNPAEAIPVEAEEMMARDSMPSEQEDLMSVSSGQPEQSPLPDLTDASDDSLAAVTTEAPAPASTSAPTIAPYPATVAIAPAFGYGIPSGYYPYPVWTVYPAAPGGLQGAKKQVQVKTDTDKGVTGSGNLGSLLGAGLALGAGLVLINELGQTTYRPNPYPYNPYYPGYITPNYPGYITPNYPGYVTPNYPGYYGNYDPYSSYQPYGTGYNNYRRQNDLIGLKPQSRHSNLKPISINAILESDSTTSSPEGQ